MAHSSKKHGKQGCTGHRSSVRYVDPTLCPVSAAASLAMSDLIQPGRLHAEVLLEGHVLRAPNSYGCGNNARLSDTALLQQLKEVLGRNGAGVDGELLTWEHGKPENSHALKKLGVSFYKLQGIASRDVSGTAGHEHHRAVLRGYRR